MIRETSLPGVLLLEPRVFGDERGFFVETFRDSWFRDAGLDIAFVQDNHSRSRQGVLRGLHYQLERPQGKLVRAARGRIFDVAVDIRRGSPHCGQWFGAELDDSHGRMLYVPPGFAHAFLTLSDTADVIYKCTDYYDQKSERGLVWNDPGIGIAWPALPMAPIVSAKDAVLPRLAECRPEDLPA